jgi:hypothetical protein
VVSTSNIGGGDSTPDVAIEPLFDSPCESVRRLPGRPSDAPCLDCGHRFGAHTIGGACDICAIIRAVTDAE